MDDRGDYNSSPCTSYRRANNVDSFKTHFYIAKLGFTGVCIIFHISAKKIDYWHSLELPQRVSSNECPQSVLSRNMENIRIFYLKIFLFWLPISNFQPIGLLDPDCCYKFTNLMANRADPDQLASSEAN